jgi:hypothetical protein
MCGSYSRIQLLENITERTIIKQPNGSRRSNSQDTQRLCQSKTRYGVHKLPPPSASYCEEKTLV